MGYIDLNKLSLNKLSSTNIGIIIPIIIALFNVFLIRNPTEMITASREGLLLWFNQVLPTLLPFVVGVNMLAGLGFIHFMGALAAPVMIPIFNVPGAGAFALLTGLTSGYPMGAKAVAHLRKTGQVNRQEAQRLMAFTNNAGPLFVIGFVGAGLFGSVSIGYTLLLSHITAAMILGIVSRFTYTGVSHGDRGAAIKHDGSNIKSAFEKYQEFRREHYKGFGQVLGSSIKNAMESMVLVGGFIIVFCVVIKTLELVGLFNILGQSSGVAAGLLEVANGAKILAGGGPPNPAVLASVSGIVSFGGFSVHGQTAHFIRGTDIRFAPYLLAKCVQALIAGVLCYLFVI